MNTGESFSIGANGTDEGVDGSQTHPELSSLQKEEHDKGVAAFEEAFRAALTTRVNQVEAGGSTTEEAIEEARRQFDEAYKRI